jgi:hypothetical protein
LTKRRGGIAQPSKASKEINEHCIAFAQNGQLAASLPFEGFVRLCRSDNKKE